MRNNKELTKIIAASLHGDGSIYKDKRDNGNCSFEIGQTEAHRDYLEYLCQKLEGLTTFSITPSRKEQDTVIAGRETRTKPMWRLRSARHPFFNKFRERMYGTGRKSVDPHYLTLLDWEFMAHWYQEDGSLSVSVHKEKYFQYHLEIASQSFSYAENMQLRAAIKEKLNLDWRVVPMKNSKGSVLYKLQSSRKDIETFCENISPYVVNSFLYKIDLDAAKQRKISRMNAPYSVG